jgi:hypothetical protein
VDRLAIVEELEQQLIIVVKVVEAAKNKRPDRRLHLYIHLCEHGEKGQYP